MEVVVEHYRLGYPRVAAFLNLDPGFAMIRRFDNLHLRVLLEQQAHLSGLERDLDKCDDEETVQLHLSSCKQDKNSRRRQLVEDIATALRNYDKQVSLRHTQVRCLCCLPQHTERYWQISRSSSTARCSSLQTPINSISAMSIHGWME